MEFPDIYFEKDYAVLSSIIEKGEACEYVYQDENGIVRNVFIKRPIDVELEDGECYDIITPYGYGGPLVIECSGSREELVKNYYKDFAQYCKDNRIVSEFIRFHPIVGNVEDFKTIANTEMIRKTVATVIEDEDPFTKEFSKSTRKLIRRLLRDENFSYKIYNREDIRLDNFAKIYESTMDRNEATDFYYFERKYFEKTCELFPEETYVIDVFYKDLCIASGLYFRYKDFLHAHLSGTLNEYLHLSPAYYLKHVSLELAKEQGCKYIHYGGGTTNSEDDGLFRFKKKFTKTGIYDFYIAKEIYMPKLYEKLVEKTGTQDSSFFPKYRGNDV